MAAGGERGSHHVDMMPVQSFIAQFTSACSTKDHQKIMYHFNGGEGPATKKNCVRDLKSFEIYRFMNGLIYGVLRYFNGDVWYQK